MLMNLDMEDRQSARYVDMDIFKCPNSSRILGIGQTTDTVQGGG